MQLPAAPSIQIVPLTRGSVVIADRGAYACTDAADILATVAALLPDDGSLTHPTPTGEPIHIPIGYGPLDAMAESMNGPGPVPPPATTLTQAQAPAGQAPAGQAPSGEPNFVYQQENLLRLCDAVSAGRITEGQFSEYLDQVCPDIPLEQVQLTRDSFTETDNISQINGLLEEPQ